MAQALIMNKKAYIKNVIRTTLAEVYEKQIEELLEQKSQIDTQGFASLDLDVPYRTDKIPSAIRLFEEFVTTNSQDVEMAGIEPASK